MTQSKGCDKGFQSILDILLDARKSVTVVVNARVHEVVRNVTCACRKI